MKKYDVNAALPIIINAAKNYQLKLNDKHFMIVYQSRQEIKTVFVGFRSMNFLHLTGVTSKLSASVFYDACLTGKLSERDFSLDNKGMVQQKLDVLPYLPELLYNNCMIGRFVNSGIYIKSDYFIGNTKAVLSVGFRYGKNVDYPVTLYNESVKNLVRPAYKVLGIFSKAYSSDSYDSCTYLSKKQQVDKFPEQVMKYLKDIII
ncbi:MAG: hypothetical protein IJM37_09730 [Lachnospiraceae bacterium]|nr:hypothetical protein [Lachnospiraceae bacterium]